MTIDKNIDATIPTKGKEQMRLNAKHITSIMLLTAAFMSGCSTTPQETPAVKTSTVWLDELDLSKAVTGWKDSQSKKSIDGNVLTINGTTYDRGVGTHAPGTIVVQLNKGTQRFQAFVGIDDEISHEEASVQFIVVGDRKILWESETLTATNNPVAIDLDVSNITELRLISNEINHNKRNDHADWADAKFMVSSTTPKIIAIPVQAPYILTPKPGPKPRITGPKIFGVRPNSPFLFTVTATGDRPITFSANNLPAGLKLDTNNGQITGKLTKEGSYDVTFTASNKKGVSTRAFRIKVGDTICLTPPLGWNSWNCWAREVTDEKVRASAKSMIDSGLVNHGWSYINIDDCWMRKLNTKNQDNVDYSKQGWEKGMVSDDPERGGISRDDKGNLLPNSLFPDMESLTEYIHGLGLKAGIYIGPGPWTCQHYVASLHYEEQDAQQFADWGFDYLKYDWCGYNKVSGKTLPELKKPYAIMRDALNKSTRDIVYSICQYGWGDVYEWGEEMNGNCWRTTGDIVDTWESLYDIGFRSQAVCSEYAKPGHWNDPDMLIVGNVGWGPKLHPTRLTPDEQYTHISLWSLLASPLLIGCDLTTLDDFTLSLLTNDEVLDVNQDPLGYQARRIIETDDQQVWVKKMDDGSLAVGLFNMNNLVDQDITIKWSDLGIKGKHVVRDLWRQEDVKTSSKKFTATVPSHGVMLIKITKK